MAPSGAFTFTKWYLDGITPAGVAWIAYWTRLQWRGLAVQWHSVGQTDQGGQLRETSSLSPVRPPASRDGQLTWQSPPLDLTLEYRPTAAPFSRTLFQDPSGSVEWRCEAPAAWATLQIGTNPALEALGYVECIRFTIPPWRLPLRQLRWGRWIADDASESMVWIDWQGGVPRSWVVLNGRDQEAVTVTEDEVSAPGARLSVSDRQPMRSRVLADLIGSIPGLTPLMPKAILALRETRWLGQGLLVRPGVSPISGRTLSEHVVLG